MTGSSLSVLWGLPFATLILSIALMPLLAPWFWHRNFGKLALSLALAFLLPYAVIFGPPAALGALSHALIDEYVPFIILLTALYTTAGGIYVRTTLKGGPAGNCALLFTGALLASFMGTTGASMLLIRPLLAANVGRKYRAHVVVFFIIIVSNVGGALTPLGDPPLFLGFLMGVDFFWPLRHLWMPTLMLLCALFAIFYLVDSWLLRREQSEQPPATQSREPFQLQVEGRINIALLAFAVALVLMSGLWKPGVFFEVGGSRLSLPALCRDVGLVAVTLASIWLTKPKIHEDNQFSWVPMKEVAILFVGIFVTIVPVIAMLRSGLDGPFAAVVALVTHADGSPNPMMYFWATGALSAFLDNAPTYLAFFNMAGGDVQHLMTDLAPVLMAISAGAVYMGAISYIGNAPNLMVRSVAEDLGVRMPSFFAYVGWSSLILLPLFLLISLVFF